MLMLVLLLLLMLKVVIVAVVGGVVSICVCVDVCVVGVVELFLILPRCPKMLTPTPVIPKDLTNCEQLKHYKSNAKKHQKHKQHPQSQR